MSLQVESHQWNSLTEYLGPENDKSNRFHVTDAYNKLRPWTQIESCQCADAKGLFLLDQLTDNPLHCNFCRNEVDPERLQLTVEETESIAR